MNWDLALDNIMPSLRRHALFLTGNTSDADDLVSESIVKILQHRDSFDQSRALGAWALRILRNSFIDGRRKKAFKTSVPIDEITDISDPKTTGAQDRLLQVREVLEAIDRLPENFRDVILLVSVEGLSYEDTSACLDIPVGTVMSRLARARKQLIAQLDGNSGN